MSLLFSPVELGVVTLPNRIVIPPMCQYSAADGLVTEWHHMHYGMLSLSGSGLLIIEATAVQPEGRISPHDLGLWDDDTEAGFAGLVKSIRQYSDIPLAVQLGHAGRKASTTAPWMGRGRVSSQDGGWDVYAPSALAFADDYAVPHALTLPQIQQIIQAFADAALHAERAGVNGIEIHGAHGYLLHQFLSPLSNQRADEYGGSLENRMRLLLEVFSAIRDHVSTEMFVSVRLSATDWVAGGWTPEETTILSQTLEKLGCDALHISTGGLDERQKIDPKPGYQLSHAQHVKAHVDIPVIGVGLITEARQAEEALQTRQADMIALGRQMLFDMHWPWRAAIELDGQIIAPPQYFRSRPHHAPRFFANETH